MAVDRDLISKSIQCTSYDLNLLNKTNGWRKDPRTKNTLKLINIFATHWSKVNKIAEFGLSEMKWLLKKLRSENPFSRIASSDSQPSSASLKFVRATVTTLNDDQLHLFGGVGKEEKKEPKFVGIFHTQRTGNGDPFPGRVHSYT